MNDISINYALRIVIQAKNGTMTAHFAKTVWLLVYWPEKYLSIVNNLMDLWQNLSDAIKHTLLTQNHIIRAPNSCELLVKSRQNY